ncbi:MAG: hypothetical protein IKO36_03795 [Bacteroidaceae bacterium]|nr:hypothetical protein [Bacteroidaceae bacterium]
MEGRVDTLEKIGELYGEPVDGEIREVYSGNGEGFIAYLRKVLENNFSVTIYTGGWSVEEKLEEAKMLAREGFSYCWDEVMDAFVCFRSEDDLKNFYLDLKEKMPDVQFDLENF